MWKGREGKLQKSVGSAERMMRDIRKVREIEIGGKVVHVNYRVLAIQRAKLLDRSKETKTGEKKTRKQSIIRKNSNRFNKQVDVEDIEDFFSLKQKKDKEHSENYSKSGYDLFSKSLYKHNQSIEMTPEPKHQRVTLASSIILQPRAISQSPNAAASKDFKIYKTTSVNTSTKRFNLPTSLIKPLNLSSMLFCSFQIIEGVNGIIFKLCLAATNSLLLAGVKISGKNNKFVICKSDNELSEKSADFIGKMRIEYKRKCYCMVARRNIDGEAVRKYCGTIEFDHGDMRVWIPKVLSDEGHDKGKNHLVKSRFIRQVEFFQFFEKSRKQLTGSRGRNIKLVDSTGAEFFLFSKLNKNEYKMAVCPPFSIFQSFCICLSRFEPFPH